MIRILIFIVLLVGCQRQEHERSPGWPMDAKSKAERMESIERQYKIDMMISHQIAELSILAEQERKKELAENRRQLADDIAVAISSGIKVRLHLPCGGYQERACEPGSNWCGLCISNGLCKGDWTCYVDK